MSVDNTPDDVIHVTAFGLGAVAPPPHRMDAIRARLAASVYHTPVVMEHVARAILRSGDLVDTLRL